jgi:Zn-dependent protease
MEYAFFQIIILVMSAVIHEYMHGWMADRLGDPTAKMAGRLTLNPLKHLEWFGSFFVPLVLVITNAGFVFGWAKPVPYNPYNLRDHKYGSAKVAVAGPLANLITAAVFGLLVRFAVLPPALDLFLQAIVFINILLAVFNLLPVPPLDGSKVLAVFLPDEWQRRLGELERYGYVFILFIVAFGFSFISPLIVFIFNLLVGR